jgi:GH25 family lysozyme M1 (1,4-beta-N-acetylmuramidase)
MKTFGLDWSQWQGKPDWKALDDWLRGKPIEFIMLRVADGQHVDIQFSAYCVGLNALGFYDLGTYFFFRAHLPIEEQCQRAVNMHGDLPGPIAIDMETLDGVAPELAASATLEALERVTVLSGRKPMLYTDGGDWGRLGAYGKQHGFADYPLWLAAVTEDPDRDVLSPPGLAPVSMRQYTFSRKIPGVTGNVDGDVFLGTIDGWRTIGR